MKNIKKFISATTIHKGLQLKNMLHAASKTVYQTKLSFKFESGQNAEDQSYELSQSRYYL
jgi:hypothetical protein